MFGVSHIAALGFALAAVAGQATTYAEPGDGPPIAQAFLGDGVSYVRSSAGDACVASAPIRIAGSVYTAEDGAHVPFDDVVRSPAASVQFVAPVDGAPEFFRIQLKYSVRPGARIALRGPELSLDLSEHVEPTTDTLLIDAPAMVAALRRALSREDLPALSAVSRDTGRRVVDALPGLDFDGVARCLGDAGSAAATAPEPTSVLGLVAEGAPDPASRIDPAAARACGMAPADGAVHLGRLRTTTGFFAQTRRAYIVFDADGRAGHVYVPGVFEARSGGGGVYAGDVSVAANRNAPTEPNRVTGCLGSSPARFCAYDAGDGLIGLRGCESGVLDGDLLSAAFFEDAVLLGDFGEGDPFGEAGDGFEFARFDAAANASASAAGLPRPRAGFGAGAFGTGPVFDPGSAAGGATRTAGGDAPAGDGLAVIPLPAAAALLASAMIAIAWAGRRRGAPGAPARIG